MHKNWTLFCYNLTEFLHCWQNIYMTAGCNGRDKFQRKTLFSSCDHEECCFWWRNGECSNSFHMKMAPYVALHFPQQQKDLAKMGSFANKVDFAMEKKHSNESSGKKFFCEPILAVRITLETFQCHRWEHNLFSLRLKV